MEIISKRNIYKFYIPLIIWNLIFLSMGGFIVHLLQTEIIPKLIFISIFGLGIIISINIGYIKNAPAIILNKKGISIKNKYYDWSEISSFKLTGKGSPIFNSGECTTLIFKDKTRLEIYDDFYANVIEMKIFIEEIFSENKETIAVPVDAIDINQEKFVTYKGHPIFSFRGIYLWSIILFIPLIVMLKKNSIFVKPLLIFNPISIFWFIINARMMHYFEISNNFIVIKNHYFFWKKKIYQLNEIREIVLFRPHKKPNTIRIVFNDFSTKKYMAGSLKDTTWLELIYDLEQKNVCIRDECYMKKR